MSVIGKHGVSTTTPGNILLGAGTYHENMKFASGAWSGNILGATNGGGKITIAGELKDLEVDGALVKLKGMTVKQGGTASAEVTFAELSNNILKTATLFKEGTSDADGFTMLEDKATIEEGDYIEGFGFVGKTADGKKDIVVIFDYAICTSGLELEAKNKEQSVVKLTLEACAAIDGDLDTLPVRIYYPEAAIV